MSETTDSPVTAAKKIAREIVDQLSDGWGEAEDVSCIEEITPILCRHFASLRQRLSDAEQDRQTVERMHRAVPLKFCLDPPDGGDVKPWEAVERLAQALADAEQREAELRAQIASIAPAVRETCARECACRADSIRALPLDGLAGSADHIADAGKMVATPAPDMVLVPREPTEAMLDAAHAAYWERKSDFSRVALGKAYRAMLAATPAPQQGEGEKP